MRAPPDKSHSLAILQSRISQTTQEMKIQFSLKNVRVGVPGIMSVQYLVTYVPDVMTITSLAS